ncbi:ATP-grasp domain-containing protein [Virgibacillus sp. FSP13]
MEQNGWLVYSKTDAELNSNYINWFLEEAHLQGIHLELILREHLTIGIFQNQRVIRYNNKPVQLPEFAVIRTIDQLLRLHLEACGITVCNSSHTARICNNKALTHHHVNNLNIPMVDTIFNKKHTLSTNPPAPFPFILKETGGRGGKQVYYIRNIQDWKTGLASLSTEEVIIQSCDVSLGKDVRVFVVGSEIVGAVLRENDNDFRANYKLGGSAKWYVLTSQEIAMINKIIQSFDFDMVGIDFLIDKDGKLLFNEIEDVVGSRTLSAVSDINILEIYIKHIKTKLTQKRNSL